MPRNSKNTNLSSQKLVAKKQKQSTQKQPPNKIARVKNRRQKTTMTASPNLDNPNILSTKLQPRRPRIKPTQNAAPPDSISDYEKLPRLSTNLQLLTPLTMLQRAASVFPDRIAIIHGRKRTTYAQYYRRCRQLASALTRRGITKNDTVAAMLSNTPAMLEAHYGVPMAGGVLNALNTRLDAASIAYMLEHGAAKLLITDREFSVTIREALKLLKCPPTVIDYDDLEYSVDGETLGEDYELFLSQGDPDFVWTMPNDEWDAISLNYISGTTGDPKGVVYHHRGAALIAYSSILAGNIGRHPILLWTLPMFHCNGWCFPWILALVAGTHVCLRWVRADAICRALEEHKVTHLCGGGFYCDVNAKGCARG